MTVWQLHMLNARGALTPILAEIRAHAREVVELVSAHLDLPRFDLVVRAGGRVIADWGIASHAPAPGIVELTLDPSRVTPEQFRRTLVREMHHLARWEGPGHGRSLGEALVSEGLAGHFVLQVLGGAPDPRDRVRPHAGAWRQAATLWARQDHDVGEWFLGRGGMRKWTGYGMGHRLVAAHLAQAGGDAASLVHAPAEPFRAALRRLMAEDNAAAPEGDTMPDDDSTPGGDPAPGRDRAPDGASAPDGVRALGGDPGPEDRPAPGDDPAPEDCPAPGGDPVPGGRPVPEDRPAPGGDPAPRDRPAPEGAPASGRGPDATPEAFGGSRADADRPEAALADADPEAGAHDAVPSDATLSERDAPDAIPPDAIPPDAIPPDAAPPDAPPLGATPPGTTWSDAAAVGATPPDAIPPDAIPPDAAPPGTALPRAAPPDATSPGAARREDRDR